MENWKDIKGYEGIYQVSDLGRVKSLKFGKETILSPIKERQGYLYVRLWKNGKKKRYFIHNLVAPAFIHNPLNKPKVNHKKGIKWDNRVSELEWVTDSENMLHCALLHGKKLRPKKRLYVFSKETGEIVNTFDLTNFSYKLIKI